MKILFINHAGVWGGASVSMEHLLEAFLDAGNTVEIVNRSVPPTSADRLREKGLKVYPITWGMSHPYFNGGVTSFLRPSYWSAIRNIYYARKEIASIISKSKADVVVVNSMTLFYLGKIAKRYGKKTVCFQRETFPNGWYAQSIRRRMADNFDMLVFISRYDKNQFEMYSKPKKYVIYDKINIEEYAALRHDGQSSHKKKNILFLGGISKMKGTHIAIQALRQLPEYSLSIVSGTDFNNAPKGRRRDTRGKETYWEFCRKLAMDDSVRDRIVILPPTKDVAKYYAETDVILFSPTIPHQTRLIYEAGAAHKPIVVPNMKNLLEFRYGHVVCYNAEHPETCAQAIERAVHMKISFDEVMDAIQCNHDSRSLKEEIKKLVEEVENI